MAFVKKTWKDRISQFPNRRTVNDGYTTKQVTVGRDEGTITEAGDSFDAANMNDLEQRIEDCYGDVQALVGSEVAAQYNQENVIFDPVATPGHGTGFVVSSDYIANLTAGDLKDVNISSPSQGEALVFDADGNLVNGTVSTVGDLDDLSDVDTTGKQTGDSLRYNGNDWISQPVTYEIDKADFDQISDFTPYANSHIVVPDEPNLNPTASDIEFTPTGNISANTVQGAIAEVDNEKQATLSNQAVTITPNTSVLGSSGFTGACYQYGKVVCLFVQTASPTSEVAYESIFLTGLPKPVYASGNNRVTLIDRATNKPYRFRITDSGQLQEWYNSSGKIPSGADLYGTIVYLAE